MARTTLMTIAFTIGAVSAANLAAAHDHPPVVRPPADALCPSADAKAAAAVADAFDAALKSGDGPAALALLADDVLVLEQGGAERSKAQYAAEHLDSDIAFSRAVTSTRVRRAGCAWSGTAWIATEARATGRFRDKEVDRLSAETLVLRREPAGWRIVHIHWSSRAAN